jgi:hypothetical protein
MLVENTANENTVISGDNYSYPPGCVPTALGQMMCFLLKYKYNSVADSIESNVSYGFPSIGYISPINGDVVYTGAIINDTMTPLLQSKYGGPHCQDH